MSANSLYDAIEAFCEKEWETVRQIVKEFRSGRHKTQPWRLVPAARVRKIWHESHVVGFVRNVKGLERIEAQVLDNIHRLAVNTTIMGHTQWHPRDMFDDEDFDLNDEEIDTFCDYACDANGAARISDYAMDKLKKLAVDLYEEQDPTDKLVILDTIFSVTHARSDLASWFIEGGRFTLSLMTYGDGNETRLAA